MTSTADETSEARRCPDCRVPPGTLHEGGCDVECCPRCGEQSISCDCLYEVSGVDPATLQDDYPDVYVGGPTEEMRQTWERAWGDRRIPWRGERTGREECRAYGFWSRYVEGIGHVPVPPGTLGAIEDLGRLVERCDWDPDRQRWILRGEESPRATTAPETPTRRT